MKKTAAFWLLFLLVGCALHTDQKGRSSTIEESKARKVFVSEVDFDITIDVDTLIPLTSTWSFFIEECFCYGRYYKNTKHCRVYSPENKGYQLSFGTTSPCDSFRAMGVECGESENASYPCKPIPKSLIGKVSNATVSGQSSNCTNFSLEPINYYLSSPIEVYDTTFNFIVKNYNFDSIGVLKVKIPSEEILRNSSR